MQQPRRDPAAFVGDRTSSRATLSGLLVAVLVLFGWWQDVPFLVSWGGPATSSVLTAVLLSAATVAAGLPLRRDRWRLGAVVVVLGLVALVADSWVDDTLQLVLPGASVLPSPGTLLAAGLLVVAALLPPDREGAPDALVALGAASVALVSLSGLVLGDETLVAAGASSLVQGLSLPTAAMVACGVAAVWFRADGRLEQLGRWPLVGVALAPLLAVLAALSQRDLYTVLVAVLIGVALLAALEQLARARRAADALTGAVLRSTPTATLLVRTDGTIAFVNEAAGELFGWDPDQLAGSDVDRLVPREHRAGHAALRRRHAHSVSEDATGQMRNADVPGVRADGSTFRANVFLSSVEVLGERMFVASVTDVSATVDHIQALEDLQALQSLVMTTVTHDLRSPLTVIRGMAQLLAMPGGVAEDERDDLAQRIVSNATKLDELITDLLDLEQVRRHGVEPTTVSSLQVAADQAVATGEQLGLDVVVTQPDGLPAVLAEPAMLRRIVDNLLGNAAKYAPGTVEVDFQPTPDGVWLLVEDHGAGVPEELRDRVFDAFERGLGRSSGIRGNGIGLSLVAEFAQRVGGEAVVTDRLDGAPGASFRVRLPQQRSVPRVEAAGRG